MLSGRTEGYLQEDPIQDGKMHPGEAGKGRRAQILKKKKVML
jgi:hypothetical protein